MSLFGRMQYALSLSSSPPPFSLARPPQGSPKLDDCLQASLDRILATITRPGVPDAMPPASPNGPQSIRRRSVGPCISHKRISHKCVRNSHRSPINPQYDPTLMQDQRPHPQSTFPLPVFALLVGQPLLLYLTLTYTLALWYLWDRLQCRCLIR